MVTALNSAKKPLAGVRIWVTRPLGTDSELMTRARALGAAVWHAPVLDIEPLPPEHPAMVAAQHTVQQLAQFRHVIFISANAVRFGQPLLRSDCHSGAVCYAIGAATASLLAQRGVCARHPTGPRVDSEALLQMAELQDIEGEAVLIVRGLGGRETLAEGLRARGASVTYLETYRRRKSDTLDLEVKRQLGGQSFNFIAAASGETVENIVDLVNDSLRAPLLRVAVVVPGERVAVLARGLGFKRVVIAANASDRAMVEAILEATQSSSDRDGQFEQ